MSSFPTKIFSSFFIIRFVNDAIVCGNKSKNDQSNALPNIQYIEDVTNFEFKQGESIDHELLQIRIFYCALGDRKVLSAQFKQI
jgi:hypothetical protein